MSDTHTREKRDNDLPEDIKSNDTMADNSTYDPLPSWTESGKHPNPDGINHDNITAGVVNQVPRKTNLMATYSVEIDQESGEFLVSYFFFFFSNYQELVGINVWD